MNLNDLKPKEVFHYFNEICKIPHGSGNTAALADYCIGFAKERGLEYSLDDAGNLLIFKGGTAGYENSAPVILQGHLDMVCDKLPECPKSLDTEGITPVTDGEFIWADGTTLGADDGIAVAYILAILDSTDIPHPPIEAVLTADEEIGLLGAGKLDCSPLKGTRFINIDSEKEGILTVSCAGGVRAVCTIPLQSEKLPDDAVFLKISVSGLCGGHSGVDIDKNRLNAIRELGRLLYRLDGIAKIGICTINGGAKENIIPRSAEAVIACSPDDAHKLIDEADAFFAELKGEYPNTEPDMLISAEVCQHGGSACYEPKKLIFALVHAPNGILEMNPDIKGMVRTSLNMGICRMEKNSLTVKYLVRSNSAAGKRRAVEALVSFVHGMTGEVSFASDYPAWEYRQDSPLRDIMAETYREMYGEAPLILAIHAGLECGILSSGLPDADMVSFGPDIENAHTPQERLGVSSAERCYEYLLKVLKNLK